ncbi:Translin [Rhodotorula diobovata]|uniref:Translin n=1 Tax=Rhodotorula diobovata TaxID=5288 RepID=A0A5C5G205_9BASI|nr:Translin [Rhodotorula diobovata]
MAQVDFSYLQDQLQADALVRDQVRDAVRGLEHAQRASLAVLSRVHSHSQQHLPALLASLDPTLPPVRTALANLARLIPPGQFYRYSDSFTRSIQQAAYIVVLRRFLEEHDVPSKAQVAHQLAIDDAWADHFFLSTEEYLHSLISLVNELSRLAINRVTLGDYAAPVEYSRFAKELSNAFGLLNLKNDSLRKRFDSIKYDVKRLEEVVYDLSLRGLLPPSSPPSAPTSTPNSNSAGAPAPAPAPTATGAATGAAAAVDGDAARPVKKQRTEEDGERAMAVEP